MRSVPSRLLHALYAATNLFALTSGKCTGHRKSTCDAASFRCGSSGACVPQAAVCDGRAQCPGAEDEAACCAPPALPCADGAGCVPRHMRCDGDRDCADGSDEAACEPRAAEPPPAHAFCAALPGAVYCRGVCVERARVCDGRDDCLDGGGLAPGTDEHPDLCCQYIYLYS